MTTIGRLTPALKPLEVARSATQLTLPWPPSVNGYFIPIRMGTFTKMALSPRGRAYHGEVASAIAQQLGRALVPYRTPVRVDVELRAPDRRSRDLDNSLKALLDSLTKAGVWIDDSQIDEMIVRRGRVIHKGAALVLIAPLDREPDPVQQALDLVDPADEPHF